MENRSITHTNQVDPLFLVFACINFFKSRGVIKCLDCLIKGDTVIFPVGSSFAVIPFKSIIILLPTSSFVNYPLKPINF
ncbi:MAG TPA: hypothetical protein VN207_13565 [Ktedonobacteraceae bacterium]|nr:hypothetical protein [Ktedonobacteraceae bacterium]